MKVNYKKPAKEQVKNKLKQNKKINYPCNKMDITTLTLTLTLTMAKQRNKNHLPPLTPEYKPYLSPALVPIHHGPMYSVYAELREQKLRTKAKIMLKQSPPPSSLLHVVLRREEKAIANNMAPISSKKEVQVMTPRPGNKAELRKFGSMVARRYG